MEELTPKAQSIVGFEQIVITQRLLRKLVAQNNIMLVLLFAAFRCNKFRFKHSMRSFKQI